jgi:hypothetical protein
MDFSGKIKPDNDTEPEQTTGSRAPYLGTTSAAQPSAKGVAALASTSVMHSKGTDTTSNVHNLQWFEEATPGTETRVGAVVVGGLSRSTTNEGSFDSLTQSIDEEQPLPAFLAVAECVASNDNQGGNIDDIVERVQRRICKDAVVAKVKTNEPGNRRKKICMLLVAVLVIAGAISAGVGVALSNKSPTPDSTLNPTPQPSIEIFRDALFPILGERLDDEGSPQFKALKWIANEDPATTIEIINQRYVAAALYFALGGENWIEKCNFLTEDPVCSWNQEDSGVICDSTNARVVALHLCKSNRMGCKFMSTITNALTNQFHRFVVSPDCSYEWTQRVDPRRDWIFLQPEQHHYY